MHDLLVRGGHVLDPASGLDATADVAVDGDRIVAIGPDLAAGGWRQVVEASGLVVVPGLVDLHTHVYWGVPPLGIEPDPHCLRRGVTTAIDAGSSGSSTFPGFRRYVIEVSATRIRALLHIASIGMAQDSGPEAAPELEDLRWANVDRAIEVARAHADLIVGMKVRLSEAMLGDSAETCREALRRTRQAADAIGKPTMVHVGGTAISLAEILEMLNTGDIVTHCFHGRSEGVLDDSGAVRPQVRRAMERGIGFDVGHGAGSFSFDVARRALERGLMPTTISSDVHAFSVAGPAYDLVTTMTKFLHLGVPLAKILPRVTSAPARAVGMAGTVGALRVGGVADITLLRLERGDFLLRDAHGHIERGERRLEPVRVIRGGHVYECLPHPAHHPQG
ncbi:MAG: amidohydrolase/deacetylase family metallohydrolase [Chloroflexi bacterium]|nr:amidohydrolase/deacetylase family metallohydrolase [Chloroflexota bacterium]